MNHGTTFFFRGLALCASLLLPLTPAAAQPYGGGSTSASLSLGGAQQFGQDYTVIAGRYGTFFVDEFEATLGVEIWRGPAPEIYKLVPELRYVSATGQTFKPYLSLFLARAFYSEIVASHNSFGMRGGLYYVLNPSAYVGAGLSYERLESCDASVFRDCSYLYPELTLHFRF